MSRVRIAAIVYGTVLILSAILFMGWLLFIAPVHVHLFAPFWLKAALAICAGAAIHEGVKDIQGD